MKNDIVEELFRKYYNEALLYTLSLCRNKEVAEDVVSTAFYKALESSDDSITNFKAWLLTVCRNEYFSMCRSRKNHPWDEIPETLADGGEAAIDGIIRQEEYRALYQALGSLPDAQREATTLFYFSSLPIKEVASVMGKSEANIKVLLFRARENMKNKLGEKK